MSSSPATPESIHKLIKEFNHTLQDVYNEICKINQIYKYLGASGNASQSIDFFKSAFDILEACYVGIYDTIISARGMLKTSYRYEKVYHIQMLNLTCYEWCSFLHSHSSPGILDSYIEKYKDKLGAKVSALNTIVQSIEKLQNKLNRNLRNITAHYDKPLVLYNTYIKIVDEDFFLRRFSDLLIISQNFLQFGSYIFKLYNLSKSLKVVNDFAFGNNCKILFNERYQNCVIAEGLKKNSNLLLKTNKSIFAGHNKICRHYHTYKAIHYLSLMNGGAINQINYSVLLKFEEIMWIIDYAYLDLHCCIKEYLLSTNQLERSIALRRSRIIEMSIMTHLYGYNEDAHNKSLWGQLKKLLTNNPNQIQSIEETFNSIVQRFNPERRNLYIHYREMQRNNIHERLEELETLSHKDILYEIITLQRSLYQMQRYININFIQLLLL